MIVVDAADNSIAAAEKLGEKSFVPDLLRETMPNGCRLVVTARSHRRSELGLPQTTLDVPLSTFELSESTVNLQRFFPSVTTEEAEEFHRLSHGIPRVQGYALRERKVGANAILQALRPHGKTVESLIDQQIEEAGKKLGSEEQAVDICRSLVILPRPIPVLYIAELAQLSPAAIQDFCIDMWSGIRLEDDLVSFRDEDFETHLHNRFGEDKVWLDKAADLLSVKAANDPYAALHLASALYRANRIEDLRQLVLERKAFDVIGDPLQQREAFIKGARLALKATSDVKDRVEFIKLLLIAAEAAKTDSAVRKLIIQNADLATKYGDPLTVQRLYLSEQETGWYGPGHLRCAASFARTSKTKEQAREHLDAAMGWLRWWSNLPEDERKEYSVSVEDIAAGTEAIFRLSSSAKARNWLSGWSPKSLIYEVSKQVLSIVIQTDGLNGLQQWMHRVPLQFEHELAAIESCSQAGILAPSYIIERALTAWRYSAALGCKPSDTLSAAGICFCEVLASQGHEPDELLQLLSLFTPPLPHYPPTFFEERKEVELVIRSHILQAATRGEAIDIELLYPEKLRNLSDQAPYKDKEEQGKFRRTYEPILATYSLRLHSLLGRVSAEQAEEEFEKCLHTIQAGSRFEYRHDASQLLQLIASALADVAIYSASTPERWSRELSKFASEVGKRRQSAFVLSSPRKRSRVRLFRQKR